MVWFRYGLLRTEDDVPVYNNVVLAPTIRSLRTGLQKSLARCVDRMISPQMNLAPNYAETISRS